MADLGFMNNNLQGFYLNPGRILQNRFEILRHSNTWVDQTSYIVYDRTNREEQILHCIGKSVDDGMRATNHENFLHSASGRKGFPQFVTSFDLGDFKCIVTSGHGDDMFQLFDRSPNGISPENSVRLTYRLFKLIEVMHSLGVVHRAIRPSTIRGGTNWNMEFEVELHVFAFCAPHDPPPSTNGMSTWRFGSMQANTGEPYSPIDDYVSAIFVAMHSQNIQPFVPRRAHRQMTLLDRKLAFHNNVETYFVEEKQKWLGRLYLELERQRIEGYKQESIMEIFNSAIPGFDPTSPISCEIVDSTFVKFTDVEPENTDDSSDSTSSEDSFHPHARVILVPDQ